MRLTAKPITNFCNINDFTLGNQWTIRSGDPEILYFQLFDLDSCNGTRYIAGVGSANQPTSINVTFPSIDDTQTIVIAATQNTNDGSIWSIPILSTQFPGSGNVFFSVTEGVNTRNFSVLNMICVEIVNSGCC